MLPIRGFFFRDFANAYIPEILEEIYRRKAYEPIFQGKKDLTIVDLGANIGLWAYYAYPYAKKLYCVEPAEEHFECLALLLVSNEMDRAVPIRKAVANQTGKATFYHNQNTTMFSLKKEVDDGRDSEEVETITLPDLFKENGITHVDVLKVDIEGGEAEVFGGAGFDEVKDMIDVIVGEFHVWTGIKPEQFETYFTDRDFTFTWVNKTDASLFIAERKQ